MILVRYKAKKAKPRNGEKSWRSASLRPRPLAAEGTGGYRDLFTLGIRRTGRERDPLFDLLIIEGKLPKQRNRPDAPSFGGARLTNKEACFYTVRSCTLGPNHCIWSTVSSTEELPKVSLDLWFVFSIVLRSPWRGVVSTNHSTIHCMIAFVSINHCNFLHRTTTQCSVLYINHHCSFGICIFLHRTTIHCFFVYQPFQIMYRSTIVFAWSNFSM